MHADLRWAARFAFLEELWRDRPRVIADPGLEAWLAAGADEEDADDPLTDLIDRLLPARAGEPRAFMATRAAATARELSRTRPATIFAGIESLPELLAHRPWGIALVDLQGLDDDDEHTAAQHPSITEVAADRVTISAAARRVLAQLHDGVRAGKIVALVVPARADDDDATSGLSDEQAMDLLTEHLGGGRLYGLYRPTMTALVDYGPAIGALTLERADSDGVLAGDDEQTQPIEVDDEVPLSFDNTLGTQQPRIEQWLLLAGAPAIAEGLALLEIRPHAGDAPAPATWQTQLHETQRQADLRAIEAQRWVERVDALSADNERLREALGRAEDALARAVQDSPSDDDESIVPPLDRRLEAASTEIQTLRWRIGALEDQLRAAQARPVQTLEAELATLRARMGLAATAGDGSAEHGTARGSNGDGQTWAGSMGAGAASPALGGLRAQQAEPGAPIQLAVHELAQLVHRIERGGISAVQLRQTLLGVRARLLRVP